MFKSSNKAPSKKRNTIISLALAGAIAITGAFAYLTATDTATNMFTVGNVVVELTEPNWSPDVDSDGDGINDTMSNIVAGQKIAKDPTLTNTGDNDAYVYIMVEVPKADGVTVDGATVDNHQLFCYTSKDGWTLLDSKIDNGDKNNYYLYAYNTALTPSLSATLFDEVIFANTDSNFQPEDSLEVKITGYAIQSDYYNNEATDAESAWNLYATQNGWLFPVNIVGNYYSFVGYNGNPINNLAYSDASEVITLPDSGVSSNYGNYAFAGWVDEQGKPYEPGEAVTISDLHIIDPDTQEVTNPNPVLTERLTVVMENPNITTEQELPVKLVPVNEHSTATIERYCDVDGENQTFIETYNNIICVNCRLLKNNGNNAEHHAYCMCDETTYTNYVNKDTYDYVSPKEKPYDEWYIYGIKENCTVEELFDDYVMVQGDGYATITTVTGNIASTGAIVKVYDKNGTETTDDDIFIEQFYVILFGDINCDGKIDNSDSKELERAMVHYGSWNWWSRRTPVRYMWRAGDMDTCDMLIDVNDSACMIELLQGKFVLDQTNGMLNWEKYD